MFFEKLGKICFSQVRPLIFFCLVLVPLLSAALFLLLENAALQNLEDRFASAAARGRAAMERKMRKEQFISRYSDCDPFFLDHKIESLSFLQKEREQLELLLNHPALSHKRLIQERLAFLSDENRLVFAEEEIQSTSQLKETAEKQREPIEVEERDLQKLLSLIEDVPNGSIPHRPQLMIQDFHLKKKETALQSNVWEIEMQLLKREFIKP